ncbi:hypothetical protein [Shewanella surugensis]|uniref:Uncharacterized protein n=1 Tax=Shewanella surugensis TaxID=212020 RepID=A0ABT0LBP8_9GAMM|nr:hypothetical protein [Shewanella surugensis]MCL1125107.1 hypothetical protein [Shewanella surugensis]
MGINHQYFSKCLSLSLSIVFCSSLILLILLTHPANASTHKTPLSTIEGDYYCKHLQSGYNPQLTINLTPTLTPFEERFYIFQLLFSGSENALSSFTKGYMLYDVQTHTAVSYLESKNKKNNKSPGLTYVTFSSAQEISFTTYFLEPSLNKIGEYYCEKES